MNMITKYLITVAVLSGLAGCAPAGPDMAKVRALVKVSAAAAALPAGGNIKNPQTAFEEKDFQKKEDSWDQPPPAAPTIKASYRCLKCKGFSTLAVPLGELPPPFTSCANPRCSRNNTADLIK